MVSADIRSVRSNYQDSSKDVAKKSIFVHFLVPGNRTLAHLADLVTSHREVAGHLRKTIDYYTANGKLPTLAQIQSRAAPDLFLFHQRTPIGPLPGLDVVGCGFARK